MLLFAMPTWSAPSELWMRRMLDSVIDRVSAVACYEAPVAEYAGRPVIDLGRRSDAESIERGRRAMLGLVERGVVRAALLHYLPFALRYEDVIDAVVAVGGGAFVHGHGYDLTWGLTRADAATGEMRRFHPPGYEADVRRLATKAMLLANSELSRGKLAEIGVPRERVAVNYLGVPVGEYVERPHGREGLFLGRLVDFKGPAETVRAWKRAGTGGVLTVAGDGPLMDEVRSAEGANVQVIGAVSAEEGERLRSRASVFTAHSRTGPASGQVETLGVAYLEALAAGLPVVSARGGSLSEVVEDGRSGLLVDEGDIDGHAEALRRLAGDEGLWRRLSRGAWESARERFSDAATRAALRRTLGV